jgi:subtilase family serine protease
MIYPAMPTWKKGTYQFTAKVDSTNKINEENEANNNASAPVTKN